MFYVKADDAFNIESPCRAHYKIKEVFDRCNHLGFDIPETGKSIDLGAAPGGWTKV
jgi:23S rRNA U2552 (ribose-2'-O)-methylase RlmE/FtsJ